MGIDSNSINETEPRDLLLNSLSRLPDTLFLVSASDLTVLEVSSRGDVYGHPPGALLGRSLSMLVPGVTAALLAKAVAGRHDPHPDVPLRLVVRTSDGGQQPVDVTVAEAEDQRCWVTCFRHVSQRARVAEREYVSIVAAAPDAIVTWNLDGTIVSFNPAAERLFGIGPCEAPGKPIESLVPATWLAEHREAVTQVLQTGETRRREVFRLRQGQEIEVEESIFVMRDVAQNVIRLGSFTRDLSELACLRRAAEVMSGTAAARQRPASLGGSEAMRAVQTAIDAAAADGRATILLLGETGVGKTLLARRVHAHSPRAPKPFLAVNCAALEAQLAESELFGHERGSFTGASQQKRGLVEVADGGTLFLDEVAELPLPVQAKLLTFLDTREFRRIGATRSLTADVRVLAATNTNLESAVERGVFRADLYYRLKVLPIHIPPLRARREDLPHLTAELLTELRAPEAVLADDVKEAIATYHWPGNLRELRNALERALLLARGGVIRAEHLPDEVRSLCEPPELVITEPVLERLIDLEDRHILDVLARVGGHRAQTAALLGISRSTLNRKLDALGVPKVKPRRFTSS